MSEKETLKDSDRNFITIENMVEELKKQGKTEYKAIKTVYLALKRGDYIDVTNDATSYLSYLKSPRASWLWTLLLLAITTDILVFTVTSPPYVYLRYIFGSIFVLFLPGYSLIEALYPKPESLQPLERLALSIGLSLAIVPLVGLVLNYTPWGIRLTPIVFSLTILTILLSLYSSYKKYNYTRTIISTIQHSGKPE